MSHTEADELVLALNVLASGQNLRDRAIKGFEASFRNAPDDSPNQIDGWAVDDIEPHFASCSLVFADQHRHYPFLDTRLQLCVRDRNGPSSYPMGYYRLLTRLDGAFVDDFLVFDFPKPTGEEGPCHRPNESDQC